MSMLIVSVPGMTSRSETFSAPKCSVYQAADAGGSAERMLTWLMRYGINRPPDVSSKPRRLRHG